ncbi:ATP-dependent DNA helicase pif1 [Gigaspora margarita]|uniref:ATP-dependent DNA helicase pif1 n=1 Tax=Gigaspora margarita TaxID=4874 RepID=A0A8H3ZZH4_GIGMA|nr:ATP-dependent DNA helicase pif1 [Gigaspora margarita]
MYIHTNNSQQTGDITVYLRCSQRDDRKKKESNNKKIERGSKINPAIERYSCKGSIKLIIMKNKKKLQLIIEHLLQSTKTFLEQKSSQGYKVLYSLETDFLRALRFLTSLVNYLGKDKITELTIDSTFKTNQENKDQNYLDPKNRINTRTAALREFFITLHNEQILPEFILIDKDAGEIAAVQEAWSWTCKIQLCLWHIENAIIRKIKETKFKETNYTQQKAKEASKLFQFIDINWFPNKHTNATCPEEHKKSLLNMIRKHICTLEAYNFSAKSISDPTFVPLFTNTKRRHDYPLICFDNESLSRINSINSSWNTNINNNIEFLPESNNANTISLNNAEHSISEHENLEKTNEAADKYIKSMETAIELLKQNKNNQQFIEAFGKVNSSLIKEIDTCQEVLNQRTQKLGSNQIIIS